MPDNCGQCVGLLFVGYGLMTLFLLLLNISLFLFLLEIRRTISLILIGLIASYTSTVVLAWYLIQTYYDPSKQYNTDFEMSFPAVIVSFLIGSLTFYKNSLKKKTDALSSDMKASS
jgi:hypothetical protein